MHAFLLFYYNLTDFLLAARSMCVYVSVCLPSGWWQKCNALQLCFETNTHKKREREWNERREQKLDKMHFAIFSSLVFAVARFVASWRYAVSRARVYVCIFVYIGNERNARSPESITLTSPPVNITTTNMTRMNNENIVHNMRTGRWRVAAGAFIQFL